MSNSAPAPSSTPTPDAHSPATPPASAASSASAASASPVLNAEERALVAGPAVAIVATLEPDGRPQQSVVWIDLDDDELVFSTTRARRKASNLERDPRASILVMAEGDADRYLEVRGTVTLHDDTDRSVVNALARKYTGGDFGGDGPGAQRVTVRLRPTTVRRKG
ncbi:PPOX class F420-dependent oxidoreductase [Compostimonas suwonensis]|uniref:PPOX class probable F420-dependent enzyme n=1 Tax=Compostimonas suwonensis TaxID=1048394 RepID=A0A2M9C4K5_9MICO|nr:PPOX class F420-dependent oxidoreductase [Compostimonas suwonensis]PJJ65397.1 PPOX class probable F420-dependent enzyme [Compostimonas suwonensis]